MLGRLIQGASALAIAGSAFAALAGHAHAQSGTMSPEMQKLYDASVEEGGRVLIYSQLVPTTLEKLVEEWSKHFPDVELEYVRLTTAPMIERVNAEFASGAPVADVVMVSDSVWPEDLLQKGLIAEYDLPAYAEWPDAYKRDKFYFANQLYVSAVIYNPTRTSEAEVPKTYHDVLKFGARAALADPRAGGGNAAVMFGTMDMFGESFWQEAAKAQVQYSASVADATPKVVSGDIAASIHTHSFPACQEAAGRPITTIYPAEGVWSTPAMTFGTKGAPNPRGAELFLAFLMSAEGQSFINTIDCTYSVRPGVALSPALPPLTSLKVINITPDEWRSKGADYRKRAAAAAGIPIE